MFVAVTVIFYFVWYIYNSRIDLIISYSNTYCKFPYLSICSIFQVHFNVAGKQINFRMRITMWHTDTEKNFNSYLHKSGSDADPDQDVLNPFVLMTYKDQSKSCEILILFALMSGGLDRVWDRDGGEGEFWNGRTKYNGFYSSKARVSYSIVS